MAETRKRLNRRDWIEAGLAALVAEGPEALKAERLARRIGTTKGSFYWHFKDVPDFHARLLSHWEASTLTALSEAAEDDGSPTDLMNAFGAYIAGALAPGAVEPVVRGWAQSDKGARDVMAEVDKVRFDYLAAVLGQMGLSNPEFARIAYAAYVGMGVLGATDGGDNRDAASTLLAAIRALEEA